MRTVPSLLFWILSAAIFLAAADNTSSTLANPPATAMHAVTDDYFGTKIIDPYRWLEDLKSPEVSAWMKAQNDYTHSVLDRIPSRDKLRARIAELDNSGTRVYGLQSAGGRLFYLKQMPGDDNRRLYVRDAASGDERLLINPE